MELSGKKINFLGDSITAGCIAENNFGYVERMGERYSLAAARNYGISGTRIARQQVPSEIPEFDAYFASRVPEMDQDADIVVVFGGTNDHGHGDAPLGAFGDTTVDTFYGACRCLYEALLERFPKSVIVVLTPLHRAEEMIPKGAGGWLLRDYVNAIRETAESFRLPVLDLFETSAIHAEDPSVAAVLAPDGLHPNDAGHDVLAGEVGAFLQKL